MRLGQQIRIAVLLFLALAGSRPAPSQIPGLTAKAPPAAEKPAEQDSLGRDTPYGCMVGFLRATLREDYARAVEYLDMKPSAEAEERASQLQTILNVGLKENLEALNQAPEGDLDDGLPATRERVGTIQTGAGRLDILLDRVTRGGRQPVWLVSAATLRKVPAVFENVNAYSIERFVPRGIRETRIFSIPLYRWLALLLVVVMALVIAGLLSRLLIPLLHPLVKRMTREEDDRLLDALRMPFRLVVLAVCFRVFAMTSPTVLSRQLWTNCAAILGIIAITWLVIRFSDIVSKMAGRRLGESRLASKAAVLTLLHRVFKIGVAIAGALAIIYAAGGNITTILAGLGLGGLAIAFAAQKTLENLFGGVSLISDEPIRVGDFCRFGDQQGTVEDIGLRSTSVRTLDRTILSIPNGQLSMMTLENFALRDKFFFNPKIGLRYETTPEQMRHVLAEIREMLRTHPRVEQEGARVRFKEFGASALTVEVFAYVAASDFPAFLEIQEEMLLCILDIIVAGGTGLAFPSQTTYLARDKAHDPSLIEQAAARVRQGREQIHPPKD